MLKEVFQISNTYYKIPSVCHISFLLKILVCVSPNVVKFFFPKISNEYLKNFKIK